MEKPLRFISRALLASIFIASGLDKARQRQKNLSYMASKNMPLRPMMLAGATIAELAGGAALLWGGKKRPGAAALALYLVPTTLIFHDFWKAGSEQEKQMQMIEFMKNMAIIGGLLHVAATERQSSSGARRLKKDTIDAPDAIEYIEIDERVALVS